MEDEADRYVLREATASQQRGTTRQQHKRRDTPARRHPGDGAHAVYIDKGDTHEARIGERARGITTWREAEFNGEKFLGHDSAWADAHSIHPSI